jgi:hypothetical protein
MKKGTIITAVVLIFLGVFTLIGVSKYFSTQNTEIDLRNRVDSKQKVCRLYFTKMWDIIKDKGHIADKYQKDFKDIYIPMVEGKFSKDDGVLMKWVQERYPEFDAFMYKDLSKSIEIERTGYFNEQSILADMQREYNTYIQKAPNRWFLSDTIKPIEIKLIENLATKDAYDTGIEKEIELFEKPTDKK